MSNFQVNDIIRLYYHAALFDSTFVLNKENGTITQIGENSAVINWTNRDGSNSVGNISIPIPISGLNNGKNGVQKKIADNDWVDKDGNHYNDAGIKQ